MLVQNGEWYCGIRKVACGGGAALIAGSRASVVWGGVLWYN